MSDGGRVEECGRVGTVKYKKKCTLQERGRVVYWSSKSEKSEVDFTVYGRGW